MRVLILSSKDDNGGIGAAIKRAFDRHAPEHEVRSVSRSNNFIGFEPDIYWPHGLRGGVDVEVRTLYAKADLIHIMDTFDAVAPFGGAPEKRKVFHHHGVDFKADADALMARCHREGIKQIVATHDLLRYADDLEWFPNPCDIDFLQGVRLAGYGADRRVRIVQSPAGREKNGTAALLAGIESLPSNIRDRMTLDIIEGLPWKDCMNRKAQADVMFDSFGVGYGISTLEAWGMGIPVIHGGDDFTEDAVIETMGFTPYYYASPETISSAITDMVLDGDLRADYAEKGWQAVNDFHSEEAAVKNLLRIYEEALS